MDLKNRNPVNPKQARRVAIVLANPSMNTIAGWPCGFWWSELSHPYYVLTEKGCKIEVFSPSGGRCEPDAMSDPRDLNGFSSADLISMGFIHTPKLMEVVERTRKVSEIDVNRFDAILVAGGQAPMFSFDKAVDLHNKFVEFYEAGKVAAAVCHGVAILRYAKLSNGEYPAKDKTVTGFANIEEDFVDDELWRANLLPRDKRLMPWRIEDELKRLGANYIQAGLWKGFAVRDGNLVTGQQSVSGTETAEVVAAALGH
ncbi:MAG: type 1 glutamine amidotransferase domain-containing protein [Methylocella sp.]